MKGANLKTNLFVIIKFASFLLLTPFVVAITVSFYRSLNSLPNEYKDFFFIGMIAYVVMHTFIYEPRGIHQFGRKLTADIFRLFLPARKIIPVVLPIYTFLSLIIFYLITIFVKNIKTCWVPFMFFVSFTLAFAPSPPTPYSESPSS